MRYKVLFIDDKFGNDFTEAFSLRAKLKDIEIVGEKLHKTGIELLQDDLIGEYDAVLLDVMGYYDGDKGIEGKFGVRESLIALREIAKKQKGRLIPWFVFTGQIKADSNDELIQEIEKAQEDTMNFGREGKLFYIKGDDTEILLEDIIAAIENQKLNETHHKFRDQLKILKDIGATTDIINEFIEILESISSLNIDIKPEPYFTSLRKIVELVFRRLQKLKILPSEFIRDDKVNLVESSKFLSGIEANHIGFKSSKPHFNVGLAENIKNLIHFVNSASHTADEGSDTKIDYFEYQKHINSPFLLYQLSFTTLDLLIWVKNYTTENNDPEENKNLWKSIDEKEKIRAIIQKDKDGNYFDGDYVFHRNFVESNNQRGAEVYITNYSENTDSSTKGKYKYYVSRYEIIN